jgi:hypothetical protein
MARSRRRSIPKASKLETLRALLAALVALPICMAAIAGTAGAATLNISPSSTTTNYTGLITFTIGSVPSGQTVIVEDYADLNNNGTVDASDMLVGSFRVTDGQALSIGGVRDTNVPGDEDGVANGQIQAVLHARVQGEIATLSGKFLLRVSPVSGGFTPVTASLTITQPPLPQGVTGQVTANGSPVPAAIVLLLNPGASGLATGALADSTGHFTLNAAPGTYPLGALTSNFAFGSDAAPQVTITAGHTTTQNLSLSGTDRTISGRVTDAVSAAGVPGVQIGAGAYDQGTATMVSADANGNFTAHASTALSTQWELDLSRWGCAMLGYLTPPTPPIDISGGNLSGVAVQLTKISALIYGNLKDSHNTPLSGIEVEAKLGGSGRNARGFGRTDDNGNYVLGVTGGSWSVAPSSDDPGLVGYIVSGQDVDVVDGQALSINFVAQVPCAHLRGHVINDTGAPVGNVSVIACQGAGACPSATTASDGSFDIGIGAGTWNVFVSSDDLTRLGLVGAQLSPTVSCGQDQNNLTLTVLRASAQISGVVHDTYSTPITGVGVYANATINGINYNTYTNTVANGNYSLPVANGNWQVGLDCNGLSSQGLPCPNSRSVTISGQDQTVDFCVGCGSHLRGTVFDDSGNRIASIHIIASLQYGGTSSQALTDGSGNFDITLSSNTGTWNLQLNPTEAGQRNLVSPSLSETVSNDDINDILFVAKHSTSFITGTVTDTSGNPVVGVGVSATATVSPVSYSAGATTGGNGAYQLPVINASWWVVSISCNDLNARGFNCPSSKYQQVNNDSPVVNFIVQAVLRVMTTSLPPATQGVAYVTQLQASGGQPPYTWSLGADTPFLPPGLNLDGSTGSISGTPAVSSRSNVHVWASDSYGQTADATFSLTINPPTGPTATPTATPTPTPTKTPGPCGGDCGSDGQVTVDEILTMVNIALGDMGVSSCSAGDDNDDNQITVDEILTAVNNALSGC